MIREKLSAVCSLIVFFYRKKTNYFVVNSNDAIIWTQSHIVGNIYLMLGLSFLILVSGAFFALNDAGINTSFSRSGSALIALTIISAMIKFAAESILLSNRNLEEMLLKDYPEEREREMFRRFSFVRNYDPNDNQKFLKQQKNRIEVVNKLTNNLSQSNGIIEKKMGVISILELILALIGTIVWGFGDLWIK